HQQVITDQNIVKGQKQHGFPMRKWKISLCGVNANGEEETMPYVDHVEYILHQTFEQPTFKSDLKPSFVRLLNLPVSNVSDRDSSNDSAGDNATHKRRRDVLMKEKAKRIKDDQSSDDDSRADSSAAGSGDEWNDKIDVHLLAKKFQLLQPEDLVDLVQLVKANQTADMYVKEDGEAGEFHIDLRTLGNDLLSELWQFCERKLEH
ncbi:hypothetical protein BGZ98_005363, partial [Dissophora globulifera]